jgi:hypothetical protein
MADSAPSRRHHENAARLALGGIFYGPPQEPLTLPGQDRDIAPASAFKPLDLMSISRPSTHTIEQLTIP